MSDLRADFIMRGKERLFDGLLSFLTSDGRETSYQAAADQLGLPLSAIKTNVHRMRRDYRAKLREEIARTVSAPDEVDDELHYRSQGFGLCCLTNHALREMQARSLIRNLLGGLCPICLLDAAELQDETTRKR